MLPCFNGSGNWLSDRELSSGMRMNVMYLNKGGATISLILVFSTGLRILHFNVTAHPLRNGRDNNSSKHFPFDNSAKYLLRDRDRIYLVGGFLFDEMTTLFKRYQELDITVATSQEPAYHFGLVAESTAAREFFRKCVSRSHSSELPRSVFPIGVHCKRNSTI